MPRTRHMVDPTGTEYLRMGDQLFLLTRCYCGMPLAELRLCLN